MKRTAVPLICLLLLTPFYACLHTDGELRIRNRTADDVWVSVSGAEPGRISAWSNLSTFSNHDALVPVSYIGSYVFANNVEKDIRAGLVTTLDILPEGGALRLTNDGNASILELYISASDDPDWGPDDLAGDLAVGDSTLWTVTEGNWDIKVLDSSYREHYGYSLPISTNQTLSLALSALGQKQNARNSVKWAEPAKISKESEINR
jgi:hypothetical protein